MSPKAQSAIFREVTEVVPFITADTAIWAAVLNPAAGAGQRHDQEPGR